MVLFLERESNHSEVLIFPIAKFLAVLVHSGGLLGLAGLKEFISCGKLKLLDLRGDKALFRELWIREKGQRKC